MWQRWIFMLRARLRALVSGKRTDRELQDELSFLAQQQDQRAQIEDRRRSKVASKALRAHLKTKR